MPPGWLINVFLGIVPDPIEVERRAEEGGYRVRIARLSYERERFRKATTVCVNFQSLSIWEPFRIMKVQKRFGSRRDNLECL